jgi:replicative DNA helicase
MLRVITDGELNHIRNTLLSAVDEIEAIKDETSYVFTTGVEEGIEESLEIIEALQRKVYEEEQKELDEFFESIEEEVA